MYGVHRVGATIGLVAALAAAACPAAWAQGARSNSGGSASSNSNAGGGADDSLASVMRSMGSGPQTPITVLMAPAVQKELKLTDAQKTKVFNLSVSSMEKQRDHVQSMLLGGGMRNPQAMMASRDAMRRDNERAIAGILDDKQQTRFDQIVLQAEGPLAVARPEVASKINLNAQQREYVQSIVFDLQRSQFQMFMNIRRAMAAGQGGGQVSQVREMMGKLRSEAVQQLGKIIDRKQKAAFNKLLGEPFDLAKLDATATSESETAKTDGDTAKETEKDADKDKDAKPAGTSTSGKSSKSSRKKVRSKSTTTSSK